MERLSIFTSLLCCMVLFSQPIAAAGDNTVASIGTADYSSIQDAVNAVNNGDVIKLECDVRLTSTILVSKTTPAFTLDLNGHVVSGSDIPTPTAEGEIANIIFNLGTLNITDSNPETTHTDSLEAFKGGIITGGKGGYNEYEEGKFCTNTIGGAIYNLGKLTMTGITIYANTAYIGGGITNDFSGTTELTNCTICGNSASYGGGINCYEGSIKLTDCTFRDNSSSTSGGAVYVGEYAEMNNCIISGNTAKYGGGVYAFNKTTITDCVFKDNYSSNAGGSVFIGDGTMVITNTDLSSNTAKKYGGSVYQNSGQLTMTECDVNGNKAEKKGGGAFVYHGVANFTRCNFNENTAPKGGGVFADSLSVTMTDCHIYENTCTEYGGGVFAYKGDITLTGCDFVKNKSSFVAGGIFMGHPTATLSDCAISDNYASDTGGGIRIDSEASVKVNNCTLNGNSAGRSGGAISTQGKDLYLYNCMITNNTAALQGGGIENDGYFVMEGCTVTGNSTESTWSAGGVYMWMMDENTLLTLKGKNIINDNYTDGKAANLCLSGEFETAKVALDGISEGTVIGVSTEVYDVEGAYRFTTNGTADDMKFFTADNPAYFVSYNSNGYLELLPTATSVKAVENGISEISDVFDLNGRKISPSNMQKGFYIINNKKVILSPYASHK